MHENLVARERQLLVDAIHEALVDIPRCDILLQSTGSPEATLVALEDPAARRGIATGLAAYAGRVPAAVLHLLLQASEQHPDRIHPLYQSMTTNQLLTVGLILLQNGLLDETELRGCQATA